MKKQIFIGVDPKGDFANHAFLNMYKGFNISLYKNEFDGYSFEVSLIDNPSNTYDDFVINPVIFNTPTINCDNAKPLVTLYLSELRYHTYSADNILQQVITKVIEDNILLITNTIEQLVERVINGVK